MRFLIVYAHPSPSSFVGALHRRVVEITNERGHEVDALDLYAEEFDPVMSRRTYDCYLDTRANREEVAPYVERLLAAEALVLVYPVWHDSLPAILKGFIDRVFLPGVIFEIDEKGVFYPRLQNIRRLVAVATYVRPGEGSANFSRYAAATAARLLARRCKSEAIISVTSGAPLTSPRTYSSRRRSALVTRSRRCFASSQFSIRNVSR